ncbi:hypothetical protein HPB51_015652 [Rhipicephalus microplus]|uniref:Tick transposon n=1 Tax=Rhipicephalus microplus TaxID=6941 RepID=A0A9J6DAN1_RHIMP|nr:hypothetical protein HPB51_015652 [Rhipicephalus microplus]
MPRRRAAGQRDRAANSGALSIYIVGVRTRQLPASSRRQMERDSAEQRKYHLVSALSPAAAEKASDLLSGLPSTTLYSTLKTALLERTTAPQRSRIQPLLSAEKLGNRRPSQLLRHMRKLMSDNTTSTDENLLRKLFLQRLPGNLQMVLATASTLDFNSLASLVDKVLEVATPSVCNVTPSFNNVSAALKTPFDTASLIDALCDRLEELVYVVERH